MKKIAIEIDEDTHRYLVAFAVLNDTESLDLCLAEIMRDATMSQGGEEIYGNLCITTQTLVDKKIKQYASIDTKPGD